MSSIRRIDINCDLGENYGNYASNQDQSIMPYISSCNIACGFHSGDPVTISKTIQLAKKHDVSIGAHPSFPDLQGFGRRYIEMSFEELKSVVMYQVSAIKGMVEAYGLKLHHVKPHGALYNTCAVNEGYALAVIDAVKLLDPSLVIYGLADSLFSEIVLSKQMSFCHEVFIDRAYEDDLQLRSRGLANSILGHDEAITQLDLCIAESSIRTVSGTIKPLTVDSICIHSDTPNAAAIAESIYLNLINSNIEINTNR